MTYVPPHKRNQKSKSNAQEQNFSSASTKSGSYNFSSNKTEREEREPALSQSGFVQRNSRWSESDNGFGQRGGRQRDPREKYVDGMLPRKTDLERQLFPNQTGEVVDDGEGLDFTAYDDIPVETEGIDLPEPIESFEQSGLGPVLLNNAKLAGFSVPTPIQKHSIPIILDGHDMMACAQTGSGKTVAFLYPIIQYLLQNMDQYDPMRHRQWAIPTAIVLAPTRELAIQIYEVSKRFSYRSHLRTVCVYGGSNFGKQARQVALGCDILVATPGRVIDMLKKDLISLEEIKFLCIDEADRMLDMGFEDQMKEIIYDYGMPSTDMRQTLMFSATFPLPIQKLAEEFLYKYAFVQVGELGISTHLVKQRIMFVEERDKYERLKEVLDEIDGRTLIFCARKVSAEDLDDFLARDGYETTSIHGDRSQWERIDSLDKFKSGRSRVLVATDVASRGIHVEDIMHVVNFDLPSNVQDYVHRIGRTGRCGKEGTATAFFNYENLNVCNDLVTALRDAGQEIPDWLLQVSRESNQRKGGKRRGGGNRGNSSYGSGGSSRNKSSYGSNGYSSGGYGNKGGYSSGGGNYNNYSNKKSSYQNWDSREYEY